MAKKLTTEGFIKRARAIYGDKYDYSLVEYQNANSKIKLFCKKHGDFEVYAKHHICGSHCQKCSNSYRPNTLEIIERFKKIHGNRYDYSEVKYENLEKKVKIYCYKHGFFMQRPEGHLKGSNCPECSKQLANQKISIPKDIFIKRSNKIHNNKYDYSNINYKNFNSKICIICPDHGDFIQRAGSHANGSSCPKCKSSKGEKRIREFLTSNKIKFKEEKRFKNGKYHDTGYYMFFDFYLHKYNLLIEYDGTHHYKIIKGWGGKEKFKKVVSKDKEKNKWCKDNNINLLRIPFTKFDKIEEILKEKLNLK